VQVETVGGHRLSVLAREARPVGERVSIGIRPQHISLADSAAAGRLDTRITLVEELGSETVVHTEAAGKKLIAVFAGQQKMKSGDSLPLHLDPEVLH
ncbi:TOBE domain-containing protein, partial [Pseudomonas sp. BGM005]|nr:TOBE domain-containing protein [Pseudomonas sp. BG5]